MDELKVTYSQSHLKECLSDDNLGLLAHHTHLLSITHHGCLGTAISKLKVVKKYSIISMLQYLPLPLPSHSPCPITYCTFCTRYIVKNAQRPNPIHVPNGTITADKKTDNCEYHHTHTHKHTHTHTHTQTHYITH